MDCEYVVGLIRKSTDSFAIKAHRRKSQNPGVEIIFAGDVVWRIIGLQPGIVEAADAGDNDRLDMYVLRDDLTHNWASWPLPTVGPSGQSLTRTFPWGKERQGKPLIRPGSPEAKFQVHSAAMNVPAIPAVVRTTVPPVLNLDFQLAPYPNPKGGSKQQVHFGVEGAWEIRMDKRIKNVLAEIRMSMQQYADIYHSLASLTTQAQT